MRSLGSFVPRLPLAALLAVGALQAAAPPAHGPGLDVAAIDRAVVPGDDFFLFANGAWIATTEIPPDRSSLGNFSILGDEVRRRTAELIRGAGEAGGGGEAALVGEYYAAFLDEAAIEARGAAPLAPELAAIAALADKTELARFLGGQMRADVDPLNWGDIRTERLFGLWVSPDLDEPSRNAAYLLQGGLDMPDRDFYLASDERSTALQADFRRHVAAILALGGFARAEERAARIYELEAAIAAVHASRADSYDVEKAHNRWPLASFAERAPGLDWAAFFDAAGLAGRADLFAWQPAAIAGIARLVESQPLALWRDDLAFHAIDRDASCLPRAFDEEAFAFHSRALTGVTAQRERWKRAVDATNEALGWAVGRLYVERHFPPEAKAAARAMVADIVAAFRLRIDSLEWMSPVTRAKAKAKLDTLEVGVGYPDSWRDSGGLVVARDDAFGNRQRSQLFDYRAELAELDRPVDKKRWWMLPQTVNAMNIPLQNALNFPAAILQPPYFDAAADAAQNYGAIGAVIGHEIVHSFDDLGAAFDAEGRLANWWTPEDLARFRAAGAELAAQYSAYEPLPGLHVNGEVTLSENTSDLAGLAAAYDAYRAANGGEEGPSAQGFTGDQRFFLAFAQTWRSKIRPQALRTQLLTDAHSPAALRALTVRNLAPWNEAFDVRPGQKLYLAPEERVRVW